VDLCHDVVIMSNDVSFYYHHLIRCWSLPDVVAITRTMDYLPYYYTARLLRVDVFMQEASTTVSDVKLGSRSILRHCDWTNSAQAVLAA